MIPALLHRSALRLAFPFAHVFWRVTRPSVSGAYAVIRRDAGSPNEAWLFVTNTYKGGLTLPGGGIGRGESPQAAARRETREEVGLDLDATRFVPVDAFEVEYLGRRDHVHFFDVALDQAERVVPRADEREIAWAGFRRRDQIDLADLALPVRRYIERGAHAAAAR